MRCILKSFCVSTMLVLALSGVAQAQIASRSGEVAGNIGFSSLKGVDNDRHIFFGASGAYNVSRIFAVGYEYNYHTLGSLTEFGVTGSEHLQLLGPVVRISFIPSSRVTPYFLLGGGYASLHATATEGSNSASASQNGGYLGSGLGVSFYCGQNWGIRPEFRYNRLQFSATTVSGVGVSSSGTNDEQGSVALFYQFGGTRSMRR